MKKEKSQLSLNGLPLFSLVSAMLLCQAPAAEAAPFLEQNGVVVMEVESSPAVGKWESRTTIKGYSGTAYYHPTGNYTSAGGTDLLEYEFSVSGAGVYQVQVRSRIAEGTSMTDYNDSWVRLVDSKKQVVSLVANGNSVSGNGWLKFYQNKVNVWTWQTSNKDNDPKSMSWNLSADATYTFQISMRSAGHAVDKIVFWNSVSKNLGNKQGMVSTAQDTELNALPLSRTEATPVLRILGAGSNNFAIHRVSQGQYVIANPFSTPFGIQILNMNGRVIRQELCLQESVFNLNMSSSGSGLYVFRISNNSQTFCQTRFIK